MRIGINAHKLSFDSSYRQAGTSRYIEALLHELPAVVDDRDEIVAFTGAVPADWTRRFSNRIDWRHAQFQTVWPPARILWEQSAGTGLGKRNRLDILHCPLNVSPLVPGAPTVATVHDIAFERYPEHYPRFQRTYLSTMTRLSARRADLVIAVSAATKNDLVERYEIAPSSIVVIPNGVDRRFQPVGGNVTDALRAREDLPDQFFLFVGTLQPRKNLDGLLRAYALIAERTNWPLVVVGGAGWLESPIYRLIRRLGIARRVRFAGYVEPEELPSWYAAATVFVFPSHCEGFGIPVLEAMATGTPAITSSISSLPEVAGGAALLADPASPADIARRMIELAENESIRRQYIERGRKRAKEFSWRQTAEQTFAAYRLAVEVSSKGQRPT